MTHVSRCEKSIDGKREATVEYESWNRCFHAYVYEKYGGEWHRTHQSQSTTNEDVAIAAWKRFVRRYIKDGE